jgi:hypothetical protein
MREEKVLFTVELTNTHSANKKFSDHPLSVNVRKERKFETMKHDFSLRLATRCVRFLFFFLYRLKKLISSIRTDFTWI